MKFFVLHPWLHLVDTPSRRVVMLREAVPADRPSASFHTFSARVEQGQMLHEMAFEEFEV